MSPSLPRVAVFTPLSPQPSGIAAYNSELLLPALGERADVVAVCADEVAAAARDQLPVPVIGYGAFRGDAGADHRVPIYHMGNHAELHGWIHDALLERPGIVVLHDASLYDFYFQYHNGDERFEEELRHNYGDAFLGWGPVRRDPAHIPDRLALRLDRRVAEASRAVVVHSPWGCDQIKRRHPTATVSYVPLAASPRVRDVNGPDLRHRYGWTDDDVVFGLPAAFAVHKRADYGARLFGAVHRLLPNTRLLVTGRLDAPEELDRLERAVEASGAGPSVVIRSDLTPKEFEASLDVCDVVLDLRWPTAGEVPATLLRAFAAGKPAIVSDLPQLRHFDDRFCWRVPPDPLQGASVIVRQMVALGSHRSLARDAGALARAHVECAATPEVVADRFLELVTELKEAPDPIRAARPVPAVALETPIGVNVLGDFRATTGLMEAGRRIVSALVGAGADLQATSIDTPAGHSPTRSAYEVDRLPVGRSHAIDLWLLNVNEFGLLSDHDLRPDDSVRYTIASWFWELSRVPNPFATEVSRPDELWVASRFVREALRSAAPAGTPITVVPCLIDVPMPPRVERSDFGLPEDATIFFFNFDARSSPARKNPWGVIEAFGRAFSRDERRSSARLVMKVHNLDHAPDFDTALREALTAVDGIVIDAELTREAMNGLLASIDVYVSLHRSEGFGLGIAEAMFLGKPAVVTAHSGNMDFTNAANSCLVGYQLREIDEADHVYLPSSASVYQPGLHWAEPSISQAAGWLRRLYDRPEWQRHIGSVGAATIRSHYSRAAVQRVLVRRLHEIERTLDANG